MITTFKDLRRTHPALRYRKYTISRSANNLSIAFDFLLEPGITFRPKITIPFSDTEKLPEHFKTLAFNLGLVELLSYWKCACPQRIIIEAGDLHADQKLWWRELIQLGLGEFFFKNGIDPTDPELVTIESFGEIHPQVSLAKPPEGDLLLCGGGKDSSLALELLKRVPTSRRGTLVLNPIRPAIDSIQIAGYPPPIVATRTIDPTLLDLNRQGYLNGHTPFSAYLAFFSSAVAALYGYQHVIVANEQSANEHNTHISNSPVNHQYSKTTDFEARFRAYSTEYLHPSLNYFSFIRPLHDLAVSKLFARDGEAHLSSFRSCNIGQKEDRWCGHCPKCGFVYLTLFPFLGRDRCVRIFGQDLFDVPAILTEIRSLCGLAAHKPFECVGTEQESKEALLLSLQRFSSDGLQAPSDLTLISKDLATRGQLPTRILSLESWNPEHFLPPAYERALREALAP